MDMSFHKAKVSHFLTPTILWVEVLDKLGDVALVILSLPSPFPSTFKSSNNLYDGIKGFCPVTGAGFLGPILPQESPFIGAPLLPLTGNELTCCKGLLPIKGFDVVAFTWGVENVLFAEEGWFWLLK